MCVWLYLYYVLLYISSETKEKKTCPVGLLQSNFTSVRG
jgi:hypothetical protein